MTFKLSHWIIIIIGTSSSTIIIYTFLFLSIITVQSFVFLPVVVQQPNRNHVIWTSQQQYYSDTTSIRTQQHQNIVIMMMMDDDDDDDHNIVEEENDSFYLDNQNNNHHHNNDNNNIIIPILYESNNLLVISKPPHIPHHSAHNEKGILHHIRTLQMNDVINYKGRIYGVHRLDRVTSGILLLAKNQQTATIITKLFRREEKQYCITKYYLALSIKKVKKKKQGWIKGDMKVARRGAFKLLNSMDNPAITRFYTAGMGHCDTYCFSSNNNTTNTNDTSIISVPKTMILFRPYTGKTHQLRVAAKCIGLPIMGDPLYSDAIEARMCERAYLHAIAIHLNIHGEDIAIWNPPMDWFNVIKEEDDDDINDDNRNNNDPERIMYSLFQKYCDNELILDAMSKYNKKKT